MRPPLLVLLASRLRNQSGTWTPEANTTHSLEAAAATAAAGASPGTEAVAFLQPAWGAVLAEAEAVHRHAQHVGLCGLVGCLCGLLSAGVVWFGWWRWRASREKEDSEPQSPQMTRDASAQFDIDSSPRNLDEVERRRGLLNRELDELKEKEKFFMGERSPGAVPTLRDYDSLLRTLVQEGVQRILPTLSKGQAVRNIAEARASNFALKARAFVLNELNGAAGELCEALDAPEAMLLLDLDAAAAAHFPPVAVLLAGLLTPYLLQFMLIMHITQLVFVLMPFGALVTWAMVVDYHARCGAIPGIQVWAWVQLVLIYLLVWARVVMVLQIREGQLRLNAKSAEARDAHKARAAAAGNGAGKAVQGLLDLRELFVSQAALVQEVLLLEDRVRSGGARHVVGVATCLWLIVMLWTFVLVLRFALVPGQIEFYSPFFARPENYCGAWATVLAARISCVVAVLVFGTNFATVCHWLSDVVVASEHFSNFVMRYAQNFDESLLGLPVAQLLAKAFLLRDTTDMTFTRLSVALHERTSLVSDMKATEEKLNGLKRTLEEKEALVTSLKKDTNNLRGAFPSSTPSGSPHGEHRVDLPDAMNMEAWLQVWRHRGKEAIDLAHQRAVQVEQVTTEDFERVVQRIAEGTEQLRQSVDTVRDASSGAPNPWSAAIGAAYGELSRRAEEATGSPSVAHLEAFHSALEQSGPALQGVLARAVETGQRVGQQVVEQMREYSPEVVERGQEVMQQGQQVMERLREYSPEVLERGQQVMEQIRNEGLVLPIAQRPRSRMRTAPPVLVEELAESEASGASAAEASDAPRTPEAASAPVGPRLRGSPPRKERPRPTLPVPGRGQRPRARVSSGPGAEAEQRGDWEAGPSSSSGPSAPRQGPQGD